MATLINSEMAQADINQVGARSELFNRKRKQPPSYLGRLRQVGRMRGVHLQWALDEGRANLGWHGSTAYDDIFGWGAMKRGEVPKDAVYLDAGCGQSPDALLARLNGFNEAYRVDLYPEDASWSGYYENKRQKLDKKYGVETLVGDICEPLPFKPDTFDVISSSAVLDLMSEEDTLLFYKQAYRLLKPGGLLSVSIVSLVNGYGLDKIIERDKVTMPGWGIGFEKVRWTATGFIVRKPKATTPVTTAAKSDPETKTKVQKNATRKERQNHGE